MQILDVTLATAAENVALDEALLEAAEDGRGGEVLRHWELARPAVIVGRSSRLAEEVRLDQCQSRGIEVVRRTSGGAAIVAGPGCLMYSLVLSYRQRPHLRHLDQAHQFVLGKLAAAIGRLAPAAAHQGTSDLALNDRKFSGNSLRCKRDWFLYHGTLLYAADLELIELLLAAAPRQPAYRANRSHAEFVANLPLKRDALIQAVQVAFEAESAAADWPRDEVQRQVSQRFGTEEWTRSR
jgi:lipoate---protein ligase